MKFYYYKKKDMMFPPFYYGFCGYEAYNDSFVFCIFPLNYFIRIWKVFRYFQKEKWHYLCCKEMAKRGRIK